MIQDTRTWEMWWIQRAPPLDRLIDDLGAEEFTKKLVDLLNAEEAREYIRSIP